MARRRWPSLAESAIRRRRTDHPLLAGAFLFPAASPVSVSRRQEMNPTDTTPSAADSRRRTSKFAHWWNMTQILWMASFMKFLCGSRILTVIELIG
ncbi:unknown protein [Oryza sativa Japonica Group]|uniref:Os01g0819300 protein n=2 Tax=Oryza sativa subsp. japonica TaxID=39947 RepID=A0A9K3Y6M3_ORYSJ|nr:unknown protein [Oryza sativa Japonica Group]BAG98164.1 unnamed protein product [Oryza sativa Japonica Group]BAH91357.1 Os01g0819300 [Oryza sativa Japonica Group]|eukprot:NP_001172627.1 Os01g0819300 [Oryza sativa Japonica Group]